MLYRHVTLASRRSAETFFLTIGLHPELRGFIRTYRTAWYRYHNIGRNGNILFTPDPRISESERRSFQKSWHSPKTTNQLRYLETKEIEFLKDPPPDLRSLAIGFTYASNNAERLEPLRLLFPTLVLTKISLTCYDPNISTLLRTQPLLKHLELPYYTGSVAPLPTDIPLLETFVGLPMTALSVVIGRPVKKLVLMEPLTPWMIRDFKTLRFGPNYPPPLEELSLTVGPYSSPNYPRPTELMELIVDKAPNLRNLTLQVRFRNRKLDRAWLAYKEFFESIPYYIGQMPNLQRMSLVNTRVELPKSLAQRALFYRPPAGTPDLANDSAVKELLNLWVFACPTLSQVVMPDSSQWKYSEHMNWEKCGKQEQRPDECGIFDIL